MSKSKSNVATAPLTIEADNLSVAWAEILLRIVDNPGKEIAPLVVSLTGFGDDGTLAEDQVFRTKVDELLEKRGSLASRTSDSLFFQNVIGRFLAETVKVFLNCIRRALGE